MDLNSIRNKLIQFEDIIINTLCERAKYKQNLCVYIHNASEFSYKDGFEGTYFDYMFRSIENAQSQAGRYEAFDENPFYKGLNKTQVKRMYNTEIPLNIVKYSHKINCSSWIKIPYLKFIKELCKEGNDYHYGDTVMCDISALQIISKRIHYGILVMEGIYEKNKDKYNAFLKEENDVMICNLLKDVNVEKKVLERVKMKVRKRTTELKDEECIVNFFKECIIPMTIQVELDYIFTKKYSTKHSTTV